MQMLLTLNACLMPWQPFGILVWYNEYITIIIMRGYNRGNIKWCIFHKMREASTLGLDNEIVTRPYKPINQSDINAYLYANPVSTGKWHTLCYNERILKIHGSFIIDFYMCAEPDAVLLNIRIYSSGIYLYWIWFGMGMKIFTLIMLHRKVHLRYNVTCETRSICMHDINDTIILC